MKSITKYKGEMNMAMINCPECGKEISETAESCPNCGYKLQKQVQWSAGTTSSGTYSSSVIPKQKKKKPTWAIWVIVIIVAIAAISGGGDEEKNDEPQTVATEQTDTGENKGNDLVEENTQQSSENDLELNTNEQETWKNEYKDYEIRYVGLKYLYSNAKLYKGNAVISYGKVSESDDEGIKFDTNNKNLFFEITCKFSDKNIQNDAKKGERVCFVGIVKKISSYFGNNVVEVENCFIVSKGEESNKIRKKIEKNKEKQKKYISALKKKEKDKKKKEAENKKNSYIKQCKTYGYESIQRKPSKYKGKKIKLSGKAIQVSEGWLDSVTLRVEDSSGDVWLVNYYYSKNENKIIENDYLTIYGECSGTEAYTSILGESITIPSITAKYIN